MSEQEEFADLKFKIEYGELVLTKFGGDPLEIRGPGEIWQDEEGVLQFKLFIGSSEFVRLFAYVARPSVAGQLIPDEDYFTLEVSGHPCQQWIARRVLPNTRGGSNGSLAYGRLHELINTGERRSNSEFDFITLRFRGRLKFPSNRITHTVTRIDDKDRQTSYERNAAIIDDEDFYFEVFYESEHTTVTLRVPSGQLTPHTPSRIREALQFILGQQLAMLVTEIASGNKTETRLISPSCGHGTMSPPLQFRRVDQDGHVWQMFSKYFCHVHSDANSDWHPISCHVSSAIESAAASLDTSVLALAVAVEGLAGDCFTGLAPVSPDFLRELDTVQTALQGVAFTEQSRLRIEGSINAMRSPRNSDVLYAFIKDNQLPGKLHDSWRRLRNSSTHGRGTGGRNIETTVQLQNEVLSLLYSLVFAAIKYAGSRTDYSLPGQPTGTWPISQSSDTAQHDHSQ